MKTVTMLGFRKNSEGILRKVRRGARFVLSHRGHDAAAHKQDHEVANYTLFSLTACITF